jgi:hypothetical protein
MTAMDTSSRQAATLSIEELRSYLTVAQQQAELYENAWFTARRVQTRATFPELPPLELLGETDNAAEFSAVAPDELREVARLLVVKTGYLAHAWKYRVNEIKELLRAAGHPV